MPVPWPGLRPRQSSTRSRSHCSASSKVGSGTDSLARSLLVGLLRLFFGFVSATVALQQLGGRTGRIELAAHDALQEPCNRGVTGNRLLEHAAQPCSRDLEHLVAEVAGAALLERSLGLDVLPVSRDLLGQLAN